MKTAKEIYIYGIVQGVGMRFFIKRTAKKYNLKGYAKNLTNGAVKCVFEGEANTIDEIVNTIKHHSPGKVSTIETHPCNVSHYESFDIFHF